MPYRFLPLFALVACTAPHKEEARPFNAPAVTGVSHTSSGESDIASTAKNAASKPTAVGNATWYGEKFDGKKTASGEVFDARGMTAAHRTLAFGTWVEVRRVDTGTSVRVRINDRGPWGHESRIIDLSRAAAERLGIVRDGSAKIELRIVNGPE